jgi:hypothetical protein
VLKGAPTIISEPDGKVYINTTGNPGMATAGSGDVLTGMIAGFLAQGLSPLDASILGTYMHGLAGDSAASEKGMHSLIASDIIDKIPSAFFSLKSNEYIKKESIFLPIQKHTDKIIVAESSLEPKVADAVITSEEGVLIGVQVADCVPILIYEKERGVVAAVHAGWRSTADEICNGPGHTMVLL